MTNSKTSVLLVEDDALIAFDLAERLEAAGYRIVGPVGSSDRALAALSELKPDIAILDVNLSGNSSADVAQALHAAGVPFVTLTGYSAHQVEDIYASGVVLTKPVQMRALLDNMTRILTA